MGSMVLSIVISVLAALATPVPQYGLADSGVGSTALVSEFQITQPQKDVDPDADRQGAAVAWYRRPLQLALGGATVLVFVWLLALLFRGSGTTVGDAGFEERIHSLETEIAEDSEEPRSNDEDSNSDEWLRNHPATRH
jgi:4-amino-4-deoxy-L-arabinose transferase-like glycosyltransferase